MLVFWLVSSRDAVLRLGYNHGFGYSDTWPMPITESICYSHDTGDKTHEGNPFQYEMAQPKPRFLVDGGEDSLLPSPH